MITQEQKHSLVKLCKMLFKENARRAYQILIGGKVFWGCDETDALVLNKDMYDIVVKLIKEAKDLTENEFTKSISKNEDELGVHGNLNFLFIDMRSLKDWENENWIFRSSTKEGLPVITGVFGNDMSTAQSYFDEAFTKAMFEQFDIPLRYIDSSNFNKKTTKAPNGDKSACAYLHEVSLEKLKKVLGQYTDEAIENAFKEVFYTIRDLVFKKFNVSGELGYEVLSFILQSNTDKDALYSLSYLLQSNTDKDNFYNPENLEEHVYQLMSPEAIRSTATEYIDYFDEQKDLINTVNNALKFFKEHSDELIDEDSGEKLSFSLAYCLLSWESWNGFDGTIKSYKDIYYDLYGEESDLFNEYDYVDAGNDFDSFE